MYHEVEMNELAHGTRPVLGTSPLGQTQPGFGVKPGDALYVTNTNSLCRLVFSRADILLKGVAFEIGCNVFQQIGTGCCLQTLQGLWVDSALPTVESLAPRTLETVEAGSPVSAWVLWAPGCESRGDRAMC